MYHSSRNIVQQLFISAVESKSFLLETPNWLYGDMMMIPRAARLWETFSVSLVSQSVAIWCNKSEQLCKKKNSSKDIVLWPRFLWDHGAQVPLVHIPWIRPLSNNPKVCHLVLQVIVSIDLHWKQSCTATYISWDWRRKNHVIKCLSWNGLYLEIKVQNC